MKKLFSTTYFVLLTVCAVFGQSDKLPFLEARKDSSGKYGYFDPNGKCVIPCVFDWASAFGRDDVVSYVKYANRYYLIGRDGCLVSETGSQRIPRIFDRIASVGTDHEAHLIDFHGHRLSPEGCSVEQIKIYRLDQQLHRPFLFRMGTLGKLRLTDHTFEPLSEIVAEDFEFPTDAPHTIMYKTGHGINTQSGLMNADGEVLIEAQADNPFRNRLLSG